MPTLKTLAESFIREDTCTVEKGLTHVQITIVACDWVIFIVCVILVEKMEVILSEACLLHYRGLGWSE